MTCFFKALSTSASMIFSSSFFDVLNRYCLFLGNYLKSNLSSFEKIPTIHLSDVDFPQFLANSLVFPPVKFLVNLYLFTCSSICYSSSVDTVFYAGFVGSCCCSAFSLVVPIFWRIPANFLSSNTHHFLKFAV